MVTRRVSSEVAHLHRLRANGLAIYLAQPEGLGIVFGRIFRAERPGSLIGDRQREDIKLMDRTFGPK